MATIKDLANRSRLIGLSLGRAVARSDKRQIANWATKQAVISTVIAVAADPSLAEPEPELFDPAVPPPAPDLEAPYRSSNSIFGAWANAWFAANFGDTTQEYPAIAARATKQDVLAAVCAAGKLGYPLPVGPVADLGDWRWFTSWSFTAEDDGSATSRVWVLGKLVVEVKGGVDPYALALANGVDPN